MKRRRILAALLVALFVILLLVWIWVDALADSDVEKAQAASPHANDMPLPEQYDRFVKVRVGDEAPDFTVTLHDGRALRLSELRGRTVLLCFFATWCPDCRSELTHVGASVLDRFTGRPFFFLPVARSEQAEAVEAYWKQQGFTFPYGLDPNGDIFRLYAKEWIPRNFIIDPQGVVTATGLDYTDEDFASLAGEVERTLDRNQTSKSR